MVLAHLGTGRLQPEELSSLSCSREGGLRVQLLGGFRVEVEAHTIPESAWRLRKSAAIIKSLALSRVHRQHREQLMDLLWPESDPDAAAINLRSTIHVARRTLEPATPTPSRYLQVRDEQVLLSPQDPLWVDVEAFEAAASDARARQEPVLMRRALRLYTGDLLPEDRYEEWTQRRREELRHLYLTLLGDLARCYTERGELRSAMETLQQLVASDPTDEEAHAELMRLYALAGQRQQALRQYEELREVLLRELDTEPETVTEELYRRIAAGEVPGKRLAHTDTWLGNVPGERRHNLPRSLTSFVGREHEIAQVERLLANTRLLTLTGTGGCGKTRLALEVATGLVGDYRDGVWLVDLAPLSDPLLVLHFVADALGVRELAGNTRMDTLVHFLQSKALLLVLDNCEHLLDACRQFAETLLRECPHLQILATSRERLGTCGEAIWVVPSLSLPDSDWLSSGAHIQQYEAVRLFVERASHQHPAFELTAENAAAVVKICHRLAGIPLALELAAARVRVISVERIAARLDDLLRLLTGGHQAALPRHQTLSAALDWSYELLSEAGRNLFARQSVFAGGWTLEAAETIVGMGAAAQQDALDVLTQLVEQSLVLPQPDVSGPHRYSMLEPVRQYARVKLEASGEVEETRRRHATFFLELAEQAGRELRGPRKAEWTNRLDRELDNLRAVLAWSLETRNVDVGMRIAVALSAYWFDGGHVTEMYRWLETALAHRSALSGTLRARALHIASEMAWYQLDVERGRALLAEALELCQGTEDKAGVADSLRALGERGLQQRDYERAGTLFGQCLSIYQEIGDQPGTGWTLTDLGRLAWARGEYARATAYYESALAVWRALGEKAGTMCTLGTMGRNALAQGTYERAREFFEEGLQLARELGHRKDIAGSLDGLGCVAILQGEYERATNLFEQSLVLCRELEFKPGIAYELRNLGWMACARGDHEQAMESFLASLALERELGDRYGLVASLEGLAGLAAVDGQPAEAARMFGAAQSIRDALRAPAEPDERWHYEPYLAAVRAVLGDAVFEATLAQGQEMTLEHALEYALAAVRSGPARFRKKPDSQTSPSLEPLTVREAQIAALIAQGLSNRQIAAELGIAERTVDNHVAHILGKLGLSARAQVAVWHTEQRMGQQKQPR